MRHSIVYILLLAVFSLSLNSCALPLKRTPRKGFQGKKQKKFFSGIRKKVALLTFNNESPYGGRDLGITATEEFRKELSRTGEFLLDPMSKKIFGSSKEIYTGGGVKLMQLSKKAKINGVNFVVFGRVIEARVRQKTDDIGMVRKTNSYSEAKVEVRIFDVNSNKEIFTQIIKGYADDTNYRFFGEDQESYISYRRELLRYSIKVAVRKFIPKVLDIASKLDWVGRVAKIIGNKIYINAGRSSGLHISDILKVITEGQDIYDPETGALIGVSKGEIKGTIEIIDYFDDDGAIAVLHSGGSVLEGDFVQLY